MISAGDALQRVVSPGRIVMQNQRARGNWLTRRAFLGTVAGAAAGASGLALGLAAEVPSTFDGKSFKLQAPESNAKRGGVLRYGVPNAPAHFDVHQTGATILTPGCMYDNLIRRDPRDSGQTIIPDLAHSWEVAKDGKTYTFFDTVVKILGHANPRRAWCNASVVCSLPSARDSRIMSRAIRPSKHTLLRTRYTLFCIFR